MGAFAIQVKTGMEPNVLKMLDWAFARNKTAQSWVKAVHAFTNGTQRVLKDKLSKQIERPVIPGYVFVQMKYQVDENNASAYIPPELWHLIKSVPGVLKLFADAGQIIGHEIFETLFETLDTDDQVELTVSVPDTSEASVVDAAEKEVRKSLHEVNVATTLEDQKQAETKLEEALMVEQTIMAQEYREEPGPIGSQIEEIHEEINHEEKRSMVDKIKVFLKNQKEKIRMPLLHFSRMMRIDEERCFSDPVPVLIKMLKTRLE